MTSSLPAAVVLAVGAGAASVGAVAAASAIGRGPLPLVVGGLLALLGMGLFSRLDYSLVRFAAFSGFGVGETIASHRPVMLAFSAAFALLSLLLGPELGASLAVLVLLAAAGAATILCMRVLHYRLKPKRLADFTVQIEMRRSRHWLSSSRHWRS